MQSSNTRHLIFGVPKLIAFLSSVFTLEPGDIISTGTPGGVGFARKPPRWLKPGDEMLVRMAGLWWWREGRGRRNRPVSVRSDRKNGDVLLKTIGLAFEFRSDVTELPALRCAMVN